MKYNEKNRQIQQKYREKVKHIREDKKNTAESFIVFGSLIIIFTILVFTGVIK